MFVFLLQIWNIVVTQQARDLIYQQRVFSDIFVMGTDYQPYADLEFIILHTGMC